MLETNQTLSLSSGLLVKSLSYSTHVGHAKGSPKSRFYFGGSDWTTQNLKAVTGLIWPDVCGEWIVFVIRSFHTSENTQWLFLLMAARLSQLAYQLIYSLIASVTFTENKMLTHPAI